MVQQELEDTEALRIVLCKLFDHLPAPPPLDGLPTVWAAGRALAGPVIGTVTVASLPEPFRRRTGCPKSPAPRRRCKASTWPSAWRASCPTTGSGPRASPACSTCPRTATSLKPRRSPRCAAR
ncbi:MULTISPECIES: oxygenase MpaB family protein [unclassified Streptomyces]|uniref:oxygenase MpaB family protein n=1 Tax=unclassified Streptomyces TaxID=2593676 RepID=UPI002E77F01B|nr:oxygenase MpaB family protein [Streptomyces sp. JV184]